MYYTLIMGYLQLPEFLNYKKYVFKYNPCIFESFVKFGSLPSLPPTVLIVIRIKGPILIF